MDLAYKEAHAMKGGGGKDEAGRDVHGDGEHRGDRPD